MPSVSVVVATLKPYEEVEAIEYLERGTFDDYEVVLRDDYPVCKARNEGIRQARADKIVFLDDDSLPREDYLERAVETLEYEAVYSGRTVHPYPDLFAKHFTGHYNRGDDPHYVETFWGNNMGARREVFETVGGWDENMGWGHEEKELASRVRTAYRILYDPDLVVTHPYADGIRDFWRKQYKLETQTPYYWRKQGHSTDEQLRRIIDDVVDPRAYVRRGVAATIAKTGSQVAKTAGRLRGLLELRRRDTEDLQAGVPMFSETTSRPGSPSSTVK